MPHATFIQQSTKTASSAGGLPQTLVEIVPRRVRLFGALNFLAAMAGLFGLLGGSDVPLVTYASVVVHVTAATATYTFGRVWADKPGRLLWVAGLALVVVCGAIGFGDGFMAPQAAQAAPRVSGSIILALLYPMIVPTRPLQSVAIVAASAISNLTAEVLNRVANGMTTPEGQISAHLAHSVGAALITYFVARGVYNLGKAASEARELGAYRLTEELGAGGMGMVWRGEHRLLSRPAAIKVIQPTLLGARDTISRETLVTRFEREARATSLLTSPHTVEVYDFGVTDDGSFYYVMELLHGLDLETLVERYGPIEPSRAVHFMRQASHSLAEAHESGLVHRDIKPANMFASRQGLSCDWLKVLDFGLVKSAEPENDEGAKLTGDTAVAGTPAYLAPEMAMGDGVIDGRADLYAFGCVGYWLLTGQLVFPAKRPIDMVIMHAKETPPPSSTRSEMEVPEALEQIIMQCLAKSPDERFATATVLDDALGSLTLPTWTQKNASTWWARNGILSAR